MDEYQLKNFLKFAPSRLGIAPKKHLLVHVPKNGGMAIREASSLNGKIIIAHRRRLKSKAYADGLLDFMKSIHLHPGYEHARLRDIDLSVRAGTIPFAVIRNPWARTFSRFKFYIQTSQSHEISFGMKKDDFKLFLETRHEWGQKEYFWHRASLGWYPQLDYLTDETGAIAADVLRQEQLSREVSDYFGVPDSLEQKNVSKNSRFDFRDFYDAASIQVVADWYKAEIDVFGFDFDKPAQKATYFT
ncbi:hypothetical protein IWQ55_002739 [Labrenzia sp. EL_208]|nr:hypothetical protein [Labrenzia sp. EL_132]MBG6229526.1 hypothetical protein [Labrenzia sp. EL_208]